MLTENDLQMQVASWLDYNLHDSAIFFHVPNEVAAKPQYYAKRKKLGVKAGVPDVVIHWRYYDKHDRGNGQYGVDMVLYIELKRPPTFKISAKTGKKIINTVGGVLSLAQKEFQDKCAKSGMNYYVVDSLDDVISIIKNHGAPLRGQKR